MPNPFFFVGKITNPEYFVGREKELKRIFGYLDTSHTGQIQHISVVGERRIGKSSLLYHISQMYGKYLTSNNYAYKFLYLDLDDPRCHTQHGLLQHVLEKLDLPTLAHPSLEDFYKFIEEQHEKECIWPVMLLDEFEHLPKRAQEFPDGFYETLRSLGNNNIVGIVTASQYPLQNLAKQGKLTSPFFNIFHQIDLGEFTHIETDALLNQSRASDKPFTEFDCQQIIKIAGKHPACLQVVASLAYEAKASGELLNWKTIKSEALKEPLFQNHLARKHDHKFWRVKPIKWLFLDVPQYLGHAVLVVIGRSAHTNKITDRLIGYLVIIVVFGLLFKIIPWPIVTKFIRRFTDFFYK